MTLSSTTKPFLCAGAAALLLAALPSGGALAAPAPRVVGSCNPAKVKFSLSSRDTTTTSTNPISIADTSFAFTQTRLGCVVVDFTSTDGLNDPPPGTMFIRALLKRSDGTTPPGRPSGAQLNFASSEFETRAIQFVFPNVTPGNYVIRMQVESSAGGGVTVTAPNTVVHYN